jgi:hypothetical protein
MIPTPGRDDTHANSAAYTYIVLSNIQLAAGEGGGAVQDVVEDVGGGMVVGGGEDRSKDCNNAYGNGHGHRHGHGKRRLNDAKSIGEGQDDGGTLLANRRMKMGVSSWEEKKGEGGAIRSAVLAPIGTREEERT